MNRASPRLVGGFILGGVALLLLGIAWLASGRLFEKHFTFVVFFPEPVRGLEVGSAVTFSGVPIGQVRVIQVFMLTNTLELADRKPGSTTEVTIEVARRFLRVPPNAKSDFEDLDEWATAKLLAAKGLRAQLMSGSLVTGQLYIDLDFHPEIPERLSEIPARYPQLPSAPNDLALLRGKVESLVDKLAGLPLDRVVTDLAEALESIRDLARSPEVRGTLSSARRAADAMQGTLADVDRLVVELRAKVKEVEPGAVQAELSQVLAKMERSLDAIRAASTGAAGVEEQLDQTLREIGRAAASVRVLVDFLERHPESLLQGKAPSKGKEAR
ncbi:MAG TPA: MlaD family protein [Anaeromyxobacteraceae bacterium]|nr:MlaD family protein [Anaeromyxobacteraceae bacterium]